MTSPARSSIRLARFLLCLGVVDPFAAARDVRAGTPDQTPTKRFRPFEGRWDLQDFVAGSGYVLEFSKDGRWTFAVRGEGNPADLSTVSGTTKPRRAPALRSARYTSDGGILGGLLGPSGTLEGAFLPGTGFEEFLGLFVDDLGGAHPFRAVRRTRGGAAETTLVNRLSRVEIKGGRFRKRRAGSVRVGDTVTVELRTISRGPAVTPPGAVAMTLAAGPSITDLRQVSTDNVASCAEVGTELVVCRPLPLGPPGPFTNAALRVRFTASTAGKVVLEGRSSVDASNAATPIASSEGRPRLLRIKVRGPKEQGTCRGKSQQSPPPFAGGVTPTCSVNAAGIFACGDAQNPVFALIFAGDRNGIREFLLVCGDGLQGACTQFDGNYVALGSSADACAGIQANCSNAAELPPCGS